MSLLNPSLVVIQFNVFSDIANGFESYFIVLVMHQLILQRTPEAFYSIAEQDLHVKVKDKDKLLEHCKSTCEDDKKEQQKKPAGVSKKLIRLRAYLFIWLFKTQY